MIWQNLPLAVCVLTVWTIGLARGCNDQQIEKKGRCCNKCPPGTYMEKLCDDKQQTVCSPCQKGYFSKLYNTFDRCEPCQSCQQEYSENCTSTTDATCSCRAGFLCSNSICSVCEENKCIMGEKLKRTEISSSAWLTKYSYDCEPICPENAFFDARQNICKPWIQCGALGLAERFPGNKTHNSVCDIPDTRDSSTHVILGIGFVSLSVSLLVFLSYTCMKSQRKHTENKQTSSEKHTETSDNIPVLAASTNNTEFHLSKEESGLHLISQAESKDGKSLDQLHLEKVTSF